MVPAKTTVAILGAGLAGLNAARLLHGAGVDVQVFEARDRPGGRILTADPSGVAGCGGFDLGPSWFWPEMQPAIGALVAELGLRSFPQASEGDLVFERTPAEGPRRYPGFRQEPPSMRLVGGSAVLIHALARDVSEARLHLSCPVTALMLGPGHVTLAHAQGTTTAGHVIAALPPRLLQATVRFTPALPRATEALWQATPTWMAPHAKFVAIYDRPFWRSAGLSGTAQSMIGPMPEIHDATTQDGQAALFGFLGIGAADRQRLGADVIGKACVDQLTRLFGAEAATPRATLWKDWAADPLTATADDLLSSGHPAPARTWVEGPWAQGMTLAGSEVSPTDAGYLAGAVVASSRAAEHLLARLSGLGV